jgi:serine/threonine protein phosphatase PrpC
MCGEAMPWIALGRSVQGAAHRRASLPNQDALAMGGAPLWRLALADGHGSARCFRSGLGAECAVQAALEASALLPPGAPHAEIKDWLACRLPREIVRRWRERVDQHLASHPFSPEELGRLPWPQPSLGQSRLAYGATLLLAAATAEYAYYLQLGDGDILAVSDDHSVHRPLAQDQRLFANETTSLCMENACGEMRTAFQARDGLPALILASTDGYANSFRDEAGFLQVGADLLALLREEGEGFVEQHLESWLRESSEIGSGDDITLGLLYRNAALLDEDHARPPAPETPRID